MRSGYGVLPPIGKKHFYTKQGVRYFFRSGWEVIFAKYLDKSNIFWLYEAKTFPVKYRLAGKLISGTYTPDFETALGYYEVKGVWTEIARAKVKAFQAQYPNESLTIIDGNWLKAKKLIK